MRHLILFSLVLVVSQALKHDLPDHFPRCKRTDPQLNDCLLKATETVRPDLVKGIPDLGIPPLEPFVVPEISMEQNSDNLKFKAILKNVAITGLSSYKFRKVEFDVPNLDWTANGELNRLELTGDYTASGSILSVPFDDKGKFEASIDKSDIDVAIKMKIIQKRGKDFLKSTDTKVSLKVGGPKIQFHGSEEYNRAINGLVNDNIDQLFEDLRPVIEKVVISILQQWASSAFEDNIPFDKLYPKE